MKPIHPNQTGKRHAFSGLLVLILALGFCLPACSESAKAADKKPASGNQVLAVVNGKPITEDDVHSKAADQFAQLEREYENNKRQLLEGQLDQAIQDRLLEAEAASKGVTKDKLLADLKPADI